MARMFFMNCPICGNEFGKIHEGALVVKCQQCDSTIYIKCNKDVMTVREADEVSYSANRNTKKCAV